MLDNQEVRMSMEGLLMFPSSLLSSRPRQLPKDRGEVPYRRAVIGVDESHSSPFIEWDSDLTTGGSSTPHTIAVGRPERTMSANNGRISQRESRRPTTTMSSYLGRRTVTAAAVSPCGMVFLLLLVVLTVTFLPIDDTAATGRCCRIFASATTAPFGMVVKNRSVIRAGMQVVAVSSSIAVRGGGGAAEVATPMPTTPCCWIASQSLPKTVREGILKQVESAASLTIFQPADCWEAANLVESASASAARATSSSPPPPVILFRPDAADLQRGEGLWTMLGPVMERVMATKKNGAAALCVMAPATMTIADVQAKLEEGAMKLIPFLSTSNHSNNIVTLKDVFANVQYVSTPQEAIAACTEMGRATAASSMAVATVSSSSSAATAAFKMSNNKLIHPPMTPANLAAARRLGVDARRQVDETMEKIRRACSTDNGEVKMVANFGELCRASLRQAKLKSAAAPVDGSDVAKQMQSYVKSSLEHSLADLYDQQVVLLEEACFEEFRGKLSTLKISPNLPADMAKLAHEAVTKFAKAASRMAPPASGGLLSSSLATIRPAATAVATAATTTTMIMSPGTAAFRRRLNDYVAARLLKATATNKFRPLPRKGVTVGLHWLFPKPFGNDYRQEPWKVHATDNMVYVPGALADVNPDQVADGAWRDAIVPVPSGKDMLYMQ